MLKWQNDKDVTKKRSEEKGWWWRGAGELLCVEKAGINCALPHPK